LSHIRSKIDQIGLFDKAELNIWNNKWSEIFDFQNKTGDPTKLNYSYIDENITGHDIIKPPGRVICAQM
jgi:hypothetical protein